MEPVPESRVREVEPVWLPTLTAVAVVVPSDSVPALITSTAGVSKLVVALAEPEICKAAPELEGFKPIPILVLVVSATKRFEVPAVFWIWKAAAESAWFLKVAGAPRLVFR
jgi:hypothetical protein